MGFLPSRCKRCGHGHKQSKCQLRTSCPGPIAPKRSALAVLRLMAALAVYPELNFVLVLVPGGWFALKIGRRGRRFFSDTGDQREKKHDEARCDKRGPHKDN